MQFVLKAVILAAGYGSRLQPFTSHRPKHMLPVGGKPILQHGLEYIRDVLKINEILLVVGYQKENIMEYFGNGKDFGLNIKYIVQHMNGKRGLAAALQLVETEISSDFCLYLADNLFGANLKKVVESHVENNSSVTLHVEQHENPSRYGVVVTNENNIVTKVVEKPKLPPSNTVITGFYVFSPIIFHYLNKLSPSARGEYELTDAIQLVIEAGLDVRASMISGWRQDIGYAGDILASNEHLMGDIGTVIRSETTNCEIIEPVFIGEGCDLRDSTIGPFATIGKGSKIINSNLSHTVVLENSLIDECDLQSSVIGSKCKLKGLKQFNAKVGDYSSINKL
ncbi:MAG: UTP--glucose-1-phosphate uridylyltransferase AglF [Candidatus Heimdallarchaeota archaeon LC_2]|nr:MAG: UTP--glucose-1-phosphate uridylyltransferase AglF [Candidatus Heimdallarchaeota archaeon LC_2]